MRIRLEAEPAEIAAKGPALVKALLSQLAPHSAEICAMLDGFLEKSIGPVELRHAVLKELQVEAQKIYAGEMRLMLTEIENVLDAAMEDSDANSDDVGAPRADGVRKSGSDVGAAVSEDIHGHGVSVDDIDTHEHDGALISQAGGS